VYGEDDLLPLSALQHLLFCERQCALIHLEGAWVENALTVEGRHLHERIDGGLGESRGEVRLARSLPLRSLRLGLAGRADLVELHAAADGAAVPGLAGRFRPLPVETKRGRPKHEPSDEVQLCAQALCLEEMLQVDVAAGALFYAATRRRIEVVFDGALRELTAATAARLHALFASRRTPAARREPKCRSCSLLAVCLPEVLGTSARGYLDAAVGEAEG
jgi:CRISPR-associated exonuclease Cas4